MKRQSTRLHREFPITREYSMDRSPQRPSRRHVLLVALTSLLLPSACTRDRAAPETVSERRFLKDKASTSKLGERCEGPAQCQSGICFHYMKTKRDDEYVCSRACGGDEDCPIGWRCNQILPSPGPDLNTSFCGPPFGWTPSAAASRATAQGQ